MQTLSKKVDEAFLDYEEGRSTTVELYQCLRQGGTVNLCAEIARDVVAAPWVAFDAIRDLIRKK